MNPIKKITMPKYNIEGFWVIPSSGFGHLCDEQPLPYLKQKYNDLTPRLGGELNINNYSEKIVPLPYGELKNDWPLRQRIFNLFRRKINIYWRNIFNSRCNKKKLFYFVEQLNYKEIKNGFLGSCPCLQMKRRFKVYENHIEVRDEIFFKKKLSFKYFNICPYIFFEEEKLISIETSLKPNNKIHFSSSTGEAFFNSHTIKNVEFNRKDSLKYKYVFKVNT